MSMHVIPHTGNTILKGYIMPQVMTFEGEGGTIMEVIYPTIGKQIVVFGEKVKDPKTGRFILNKPWQTYTCACALAAFWEFPAPLSMFFRKRAEEWRSYTKLIALSIQNNFAEALDLALTVAKDSDTEPVS